MSDLSVPPISLLPLDAADTGRAAAAPPAAAAGARFAWPTPNLPCYPAPQPALAPEACVIEGLNGSTMAGRLMHFSADAGLAHVQVSASRTTLPLRFSQFRALRLAKPLNPLPFDPTETTPLALTPHAERPTSRSRLMTMPAASRSQVSAVMPSPRRMCFCTFWVGVLGRSSSTRT